MRVTHAAVVLATLTTAETPRPRTTAPIAITNFYVHKNLTHPGRLVSAGLKGYTAFDKFVSCVIEADSPDEAIGLCGEKDRSYYFRLYNGTAHEYGLEFVHQLSGYSAYRGMLDIHTVCDAEGLCRQPEDEKATIQLIGTPDWAFKNHGTQSSKDRDENLPDV